MEKWRIIDDTPPNSTGVLRAATRLVEHRKAQAERLRDAPAQRESRQVRRRRIRLAVKSQNREYARQARSMRLAGVN